MVLILCGRVEDPVVPVELSVPPRVLVGRSWMWASWVLPRGWHLDSFSVPLDNWKCLCPSALSSGRWTLPAREGAGLEVDRILPCFCSLCTGSLLPRRADWAWGELQEGGKDKWLRQHFVRDASLRSSVLWILCIELYLTRTPLTIWIPQRLKIFHKMNIWFWLV